MSHPCTGREGPPERHPSPRRANSYGIDAQAVGVGDGEGVVFVGDDEHVGHGVHPEGVVVGPVHRADVQRERRQVALG